MGVFENGGGALRLVFGDGECSDGFTAVADLIPVIVLVMDGFAALDAVEVDALEHRVVALRGAAGDEDVVFLERVDALIEAVHGHAQVGMDLGAEAVQRVGVAVSFTEIGLHGLLDHGVYDGGRVVVQVDAFH